MFKMKYKNILLVLTLIFPLVACDQVKQTLNEKIEDFIADGSEQQNEKAAALFQAIIARDQAKILSLSDADLRQKLIKDPDVLMRIYGSLPEQVTDKPQVVMKTKAVELAYGKVTKIGYKYSYPDNTIIFVVAFSGYDGGDQVVGFWVQELYN